MYTLLVFGFTWKATPLAIVLFGLFLLYLHSGWFIVDLSHPITPLRRDARGQDVQRKALIGSVVLGLLVYTILAELAGPLGLSLATGQVALSLGNIIYFVTQFFFLARA
jgi:hypothetical protein